MNILIIEDSIAKRDSIALLLDKNFNISTPEVSLSVRSAIDSISRRTPDLIIADMSLPTYDIENRERGGTPRPFGGIEIFDYLDRLEVIVPVVVVTSYPTLGDGENAVNLNELRDKLKDDFPDNYFGVVYFDSAYTTWESDLLSIIKPIISK